MLYCPALNESETNKCGHKWSLAAGLYCTPEKLTEPATYTAPILLVDDEDTSSQILLSDLNERGFRNVTRTQSGDAMRSALEAQSPLVAILNFHFHHQTSLEACRLLKDFSKEIAVVVIASTGPSTRLVREFAKQSQAVDAVIEKPLSDERFFLVLRELAAARQTTKALRADHDRIEKLLPAGAIAAISGQAPTAEMFEAAVLFTDIRRSTELITRSSPAKFFDLLNSSLSAQADEIANFKGAVVKYTGDGVFATFRGMGRTYLAVRCATVLARLGRQEELPFGIGVADGIVVSGFVGDSNKKGTRRQYDVVGATVNLAARLSSTASPGEVLLTHSLYQRMRWPGVTARSVGALQVKGFADPIDCVAYLADDSAPTS